MSTRCITKFFYAGDDEPVAQIYRHSDGYPDGAGVDLVRFLDETKKLEGTTYGSRHDDASYLAAKYVVFLADMFNNSYRDVGGVYTRVKNDSPLDFGSVGVLSSVPGDVEYIYHVRCGRPPVLTCFSATSDDSDETIVWHYRPMTEGEQVDIPGNTYTVTPAQLAFGDSY